MTKRFNPYRDLQENCRAWARTVVFANKRLMFYYPKDRIGIDQWNLIDLKERTIAAEQLGYEVVLEWKENAGLQVFYRKKHDSPPWSIAP